MSRRLGLAALVKRIAQWTETMRPAVTNELSAFQADPPIAYPAAPMCAPVHLLLDDGLAHVDGARLAVSTATDATRYFSIPTLAQVSIHGNAGITSPALRLLFKEGVPVLWRDHGGRLAGVAADMTLRVTEIRRAQYAAQDNNLRRLEIARACVVAKISSSRGLLRRRNADTRTLDQLALLCARIADVADHAQLLGIEGAAAQLFFAAWTDLIDPQTAFIFEARRRRPPPDPVNAMLSYCYAVLTGEAAIAALAAGLDPHAGFLHSERAGRPALALDLVEPLRPLVAERVVLRAINRRQVLTDGFIETHGEGVRMNDETRRTLLSTLEERLAERAPGGDGLDYRAALAADAMSLAASLRSGSPFVSRLVKA